MNLEIVREFCHETCRLDTFNSSQQILVHYHDGSFDYHQVHIKNQSIKEYYKIFEKSSIYAIWQRENATSRNGIEKIPTLKFRSFSNAFWNKNSVYQECDSSEEISSCSDVPSELSLDFDDISEGSVESDGEAVVRVKK